MPFTSIQEVWRNSSVLMLRARAVYFHFRKCGANHLYYMLCTHAVYLHFTKCGSNHKVVRQIDRTNSSQLPRDVILLC